MIFEIIIAACVILLTSIFLYRRRRITRPYNEIYVVITGCDTGFGRLAAERFDGLGMHVFAGCLQEESTQELRESCSDRIFPVLLDVTKQDDIQRLVSVVKEKIPHGKGLSGLLNNAGINGIDGLLESLGSEQFMPAFKVNLFGTIDVTKSLMPFLRRGKGRIISTTSGAGKMATGIIGPYCATKHALESYSDSLRRELYHDDISVHIIEPGVFNTQIFFNKGYGKSRLEYFNALPEETRLFYGEDMIERIEKALLPYQEAADKKIDKVVDAYLHALTSSYPKIRYRVGRDVQFLIPIVNYLPEWVIDILVGQLMPVPKGKQNVR
ncbi:hypothetical protein FSP39_003745 [Pinctada imbricata]|uniref:Uncharacterized protein n=1 Tax=Pinctada imbricata TaxID=66713 RepID=A0AA89C0H0_PINIB|nr:hypothetical protein FSP39_003745 [Pinctada imbricata]